MLLIATIIATFFYNSKNTLFTPALSLASFIIGIYLQQTINAPVAIMFTAYATTLGACYFLKKEKYKNTATIVSMLFLGSLRMNQDISHQEALQKNIEGKTFNAIATIKDKSILKQGRFKETLTLSIEKINNTDTQKVLIKTYLHTKTPLQVEDRIQIDDLQIPKAKQSRTLTGNPTFSDYLTKEGVATAIFPKNFTYKLINRKKICPTRWLQQKRNRLQTALQAKLTPTTSTLFSRIFLGLKQKSNSSQESFYHWGISHYLARSGLHVALLILGWGKLLNFLPVPFLSRVFLLLLLCTAYGALSWPSISFLRAFFVFVLFCMGRLFGRQTSIFYLLTLVCMAVVLMNPSQVFFLDFQLSFGLTFALLFLSMNKAGRKPHS